MEEFKYFNVIIKENKLVFKTNKVPNAIKDDYIDEIATYLFLGWFDHNMHIIFVMIREMFKNVYDHGTGEATLTLIKNDKNYSFEFIDHNTEIISYDKCCKIEKGRDWVQKSDSNRNRGMWMINSLAKEEGITLNVDDTKGGINYSGTYLK